MKRLLVALLIVPPAFECAVRVDDLVRFGVPFTSGVTSILDLRVEDSLGRHARAGAAWEKFKINSLGFRGPEVSRERIAEGPLVVIAGASETFGLYESEGREWPRQLDDSLAIACRTRPPVVLNSALAGMSLPTVMQDLERRVLPMKPSVVVYYPQPASYLFERVPRAAPIPTTAAAPLSPWRLRSYARLREGLKSIVPEAVLDLNRRRQTEQARRTGEAMFPALPVERLDSMEAHLRTLAGLVHRHGARLALVVPRNRLSDTITVSEQRWLRAWEQVNPQATGAMILAFADSGIVRVRRVAADSGLPLVDAAFPGGLEQKQYFADPNHFTDRGSALMAGAGAAVVGRMLGCSP